jgi:hypothetical protein
MIEERTGTVIDPVTHLFKQIPVTPVPELIAAADRLSAVLRRLRGLHETGGAANSPVGLALRRALEDAHEKAWSELDSKIGGAEGEAWLILIDIFLGSSPYNGPREPTTPELVELKQVLEQLLELSLYWPKRPTSLDQ